MRRSVAYGLVILATIVLMYDGGRLAEAVALNGTYYGTYWDVDTHDITSLADADDIVAGGGSTGTFMSSAVDYTGKDYNSIKTFLGADGDSYYGDEAGNMGDGVIYLYGHYEVTSPGVLELSLTSDDGARVTVDGVVVIDNDGLHSPTTKDATVDFLTAGSYEIEILYFNHIYNVMTNAPDGTGGARLALDHVYYATPEPSASLLLGLGFMGLAAFGWWRKREPRTEMSNL